MYNDNGWMWGHGWGWGGGVLMGVLMILFVVALVTALVLAIRYLTVPQRVPGPSAGNTEDRSERLLAERFARGEIDEDEYRRRMTVLREHS
ncbi:MAG: SHOCT domain-containing protein [Mycolicibacterium sp.]|uniref:SHOCT domain-containing protein n=1 Tax=Mycolicibacterium sp. TaxID=2320850 RepID=UPI003D0B000C